MPCRGELAGVQRAARATFLRIERNLIPSCIAF